MKLMRSRRLNRHALVIVLGWFLFWIFVGLTASFLGGCSEVRYITQPLPLPTRPALPAIKETELQCLSPDAYHRLVERERLRREYAEKMEAIIGATQESR